MYISSDRREIPHGGNDTPSLDTYSKTMDECPRRGKLVMVCVQDPGRMFLAGCSSYKCPVCGPQKVSTVVEAMSYVQHLKGLTRFITLTMAPTEFESRRQKMADMARWAKKQGLDWQVAWTTEQGSKTGMTHIHALQWGSRIPQADLQDRWGHIVDIRAVRDDAKKVGRYMAKGSQVSRYMAKGARQEAYGSYLALNQGRPLRWSRAFFGGLTPKEAARLYRIEVLGREALTWRLAEPDEARLYLDSRLIDENPQRELLTGSEPGLY